MKLVVLLLASFTALFLAIPARAPAQEFEVASIRPAVQDGNHDFDSDKGRLTTHNLTLKRLIALAWDVDETEVFGGPNWMDSDSWDVNAKIPAEYGKRTPEKFRHMIQNLLATRFQLTIHREPRRLSGYELVTAKSGSKMAIAKADENGSDFRAKNTHLIATSVTMDAFARHLSRDKDIGKVVVDRTGLTDRFDFVLDWAREDTSSSADDRPSIFTALQEQLGLKLEAAKVPVQAIVIDRAEKPADN